MPDILDTICAWLGEGRALALATVVETWRSAPVGVGGQLVVDAQGNFEGSVSGGCVEAEVVARSPEVISTAVPQLLEFGVEDETAWKVGLPCGGNIRVLLSPLARENALKALGAVQEARNGRRPVVAVTSLADGTLAAIEAGEAKRAGGDLEAALETGTSRLGRADEGEVFLQAYLPPPRILISGATHIAQILIRLASDSGYGAVIVDPRGAFASDDRFAGADIVVDWPVDALPSLGLDGFTAVVALAHQGEIDDQALFAALRSPVFYVGALSSRRTHAKRIGRLMKMGLSEAEIARIHAPIGLDIGAETPGEIAVSIMSEIISEFRGPARAGK
ncbi:MAG: XdhC family protein [Hyphomicrobiales bacterium]